MKTKIAIFIILMMTYSFLIYVKPENVNSFVGTEHARN